MAPKQPFAQQPPWGSSLAPPLRTTRRGRAPVGAGQHWLRSQRRDHGDGHRVQNKRGRLIGSAGTVTGTVTGTDGNVTPGSWERR